MLVKQKKNTNNLLFIRFLKTRRMEEGATSRNTSFFESNWKFL